ncbi:hypothetical protein FIBSPDRAFT_1048624 [Athelia psychrophila]|uniref:Uncharacterized protein n=1 Tax=Athelia psychrophila TaxID=1759441 RepID=A0A166DHZ2_9AGAM|nr:hypothetical protein FIBSPDRAFT_1048624 [Fibularhizoctonia sp. CBS 109695]
MNGGQRQRGQPPTEAFNRTLPGYPFGTAITNPAALLMAHQRQGPATPPPTHPGLDSRITAGLPQRAATNQNAQAGPSTRSAGTLDPANAAAAPGGGIGVHPATAQRAQPAAQERALPECPREQRYHEERDQLREECDQVREERDRVCAQLREIIEFSEQEVLRIRAVQATNTPALEPGPPPPAAPPPAAPPPARAASPPAAPGGPPADAQLAAQANTGAAGPAAAALPAGNPPGAPQPAAAVAGGAAIPQLLHRLGNQAAFHMVANQADIDRADAAKRDTRIDAKKVTLPELISGTKASSLNLPIPPRVEAAFKAYSYVPYTSLTTAARAKAQQGEEEVVMDARSGFKHKVLETAGEKNISKLEWQAAGRAAVQRWRVHYGNKRADALAAHHLVVEALALAHSWQLAMDYDVQQRTLAANMVEHDLTDLDLIALAMVQLKYMTISSHQQSAGPSRQYPSSPLKRPSPSGDAAHAPQAPPRKRTNRTYCFRCGGGGHLPGDYVASTTATGRIPATIVRSARSKHAMAAPGGLEYCFAFAQGACKQQDCNRGHSCSICGDTGHGAGSCKHAV